MSSPFGVCVCVHVHLCEHVQASYSLGNQIQSNSELTYMTNLGSPLTLGIPSLPSKAGMTRVATATGHLSFV